VATVTWTDGVGPKIMATFSNIGRGIWNYVEMLSTARAAGELTRLGYHQEARNLMLGTTPK